MKWFPFRTIVPELNCRIQEEREERHKYKGALKSALDEPELSKGELFFCRIKNDPLPCEIYVSFLSCA